MTQNMMRQLETLWEAHEREFVQDEQSKFGRESPLQRTERLLTEWENPDAFGRRTAGRRPSRDAVETGLTG